MLSLNEQATEKTSEIAKVYFENKESFYKFIKDNYDISRENGFLGFTTEEVTLDKHFEHYEKVCENICNLIKDNTLAEEITKLSYDETFLNENTDSKIDNKLFAILTTLTNGFLHSSKKEKQMILPKQLGIPLFKVSERLKIKPVYSVWTSLHSIKLLNEDKASLKNTTIRYSFTNTKSEDYFFKVNFVVDIELKKLFEIFFNINRVVYKYLDKETNELNGSFTSEDIEKVNYYLKLLFEVISYLNNQTAQLFIHMDKNEFYIQLRPYIVGYSVFEDVVYFEGIDKVFRYTGAHAGQDPYSQFLKAILGVDYSKNKELVQYSLELKESLREPHRRFVEFVEKYSLIWKIKELEAFKTSFSEVMGKMKIFYQNIHNGFIKKFIEEVNDVKGTGTGDTNLELIKSLHTNFN